MEQIQPISVSVADACRIVGIGRTKLFELIATKKVDAVKLGTRTLIKYDSLHRLIDELAAPVKEAA